MEKRKRQKFVKLLLAGLLMVACFGVTGNPTVYASENNTTQRTINVSGVHSVKVAPDMAYIDITVQTFDVQPIKAQEKNKTKMSNVIDKLHQLGINEQDIRTVDYRVQPKYEWKNIEVKNSLDRMETKREQILVGYDVINSIKVTVTEFAKIGSIIDLTVKEGVNKVNNIAFGLSEASKNKKYLEALKGAVENGKAKAEFIATMYGISLAIPTSIKETGSYFPSPITYRGVENMSAGGGAADSVQSTPISGGELEIQATVDMVYSY